jgi:hypothetical protein
LDRLPLSQTSHHITLHGRSHSNLYDLEFSVLSHQDTHLTKLRSTPQFLLRPIEPQSLAPSFHSSPPPNRPENLLKSSCHILDWTFFVCFLFFLLFLLSFELFSPLSVQFLSSASFVLAVALFSSQPRRSKTTAGQLFVGPIHERCHERFHEPLRTKGKKGSSMSSKS